MENDSPSDIVIVPRENANNENTDEDSGDEDDVILDNLPGSQLLAEAEVLHDSTAADTEVSADGFDSEGDLPLSTFGTKVAESKVAKKSCNHKWNNRDIESDIPAFVPTYGPKRLYTPLEAFFLFFDNEVIGTLRYLFIYFLTIFSLPLHLLEELRIMGLKGTIRENRVGKVCPLSRSTEMRKKERGAIEFVSSNTNTISLCKWHDNSVVAIASNHTKILPTLPVKRFCRKEKKMMYVPQPHAIKMYNENMGGVDRAGQNISLYRTQIKGKKWYFPLIAHCLDMAEQNAWQLYRLGGGKKDHLRFRQSVATSILETYKKIQEGDHTIAASLQIFTKHLDTTDWTTWWCTKKNRPDVMRVIKTVISFVRNVPLLCTPKILLTTILYKTCIMI
nr:unnamed protein product [Callosobruchus analis]